MRRITRAMTAAVVLGVVTTIAVAWGSALAFDVGGGPPGRVGLVRAGDEYRSVQVFHRPTAYRLKLSLNYCVPDGPLYGRRAAEHVRMGEPDVPAWSIARAPRPGAERPANGSHEFCYQIEEARGWPWLALVASPNWLAVRPARFEDRHPAAAGVDHAYDANVRGNSFDVRTLPPPDVEDGLRIPSWWPGLVGEEHAVILPLRPHWPGFLADTALFSVMWLALLGIRLAPAEWRRWRGRCPRCSFDLRWTPTRCPECGWAAPSARPR